MGMPAARIGDMHVCPMATPGTPPIPHVGGPILPPCAITVLTGGIPQARVSDMCVCVGPPDVIAKGSLGVLVAGMPAARIGDMTVHGGNIIMGLPTVLIGDTGGGSSSSGGAPGAGAGMGQSAGSTTSFSGKTYAVQDTQAKVQKQAAKDGTPFCEQCQKAG